MSLFGKKGSADRNTGRGGYHPGAVNDTANSSAAGSLGTTTLGGTGSTTSDTTVTSVSGRREIYDPWGNPISYSIVSGSLPPGFSLNTSTGQITGSYTVAGINTDGQVYSFTIRATNNINGLLSTSDRAYTVTLSVPWLYRQIITTGYMAGGYQNSSLWSNVNRFPRSTEVCTNLGDGLIDNYHYKSGMCSTDRGHIFNGNSTTTFNMRTESKINGYAAPGYNCANTTTAFAPDRNRGFLCGENVGTLVRFTDSTNSFTNLGGGQGGHACSVSGENKGIFWGDANRSVNFSTEAQTAISMAGGAHGQQKGLSAKTGYGYGGNEGTYNGGYNWRKINITNETYGTITKAWANCGEENYCMTQDRGYILGNYDGGGQNNGCARVIYATDAIASGFTSVQGHGGASSGHCFWRD